MLEIHEIRALLDSEDEEGMVNDEAIIGALSLGEMDLVASF